MRWKPPKLKDLCCDEDEEHNGTVYNVFEIFCQLFDGSRRLPNYLLLACFVLLSFVCDYHGVNFFTLALSGVKVAMRLGLRESSSISENYFFPHVKVWIFASPFRPTQRKRERIYTMRITNKGKQNKTRKSEIIRQASV